MGEAYRGGIRQLGHAERNGKSGVHVGRLTDKARVVGTRALLIYTFLAQLMRSSSRAVTKSTALSTRPPGVGNWVVWGGEGEEEEGAFELW